MCFLFLVYAKLRNSIPIFATFYKYIIIIKAFLWDFWKYEKWNELVFPLDKFRK